MAPACQQLEKRKQRYKEKSGCIPLSLRGQEGGSTPDEGRLPEALKMLFSPLLPLCPSLLWSLRRHVAWPDQRRSSLRRKGLAVSVWGPFFEAIKYLENLGQALLLFCSLLTQMYLFCPFCSNLRDKVDLSATWKAPTYLKTVSYEVMSE